MLFSVPSRLGITDKRILATHSGGSNQVATLALVATLLLPSHPIQAKLALLKLYLHTNHVSIRENTDSQVSGSRLVSECAFPLSLQVTPVLLGHGPHSEDQEVPENLQHLSAEIQKGAQGAARSSLHRQMFES